LKILQGRPSGKVTYPEATDQCMKMGLQIALPGSSYENQQDSIFERIIPVTDDVHNLKIRENTKILYECIFFHGLPFVSDKD